MNQAHNQQGNHKTITAMQTSGRCCTWIMQAPPVAISGVCHPFKSDFSDFQQPDFYEKLEGQWRCGLALHGFVFHFIFHALWLYHILCYLPYTCLHLYFIYWHSILHCITRVAQQTHLYSHNIPTAVGYCAGQYPCAQLSCVNITEK